MRSTAESVVPRAFPAIEESAPLPVLKGDGADLIVGLAALRDRLKQSTVHGAELDAAATQLRNWQSTPT
jgi:hypothetical protein